MRNTRFSPNFYYHIVDRGVDDKEVFLEHKDYLRFLVSLFVFNDEKLYPDHVSQFIQDPTELIKVYSVDQRRRLVDIIAFTLLPNHFHIFIKEKEKNVISRLMHRLCMGYTHYFNLKYHRKGVLWQGTFHAELIDEEAYFLHIVSYIHLNILDLYFFQWRNGMLGDWDEAKKKMQNYRWSSYAYYRHKKMLIPFIDLILERQDWFGDYFSRNEDFEKNLQLWSQRNLGNFL